MSAPAIPDRQWAEGALFEGAGGCEPMGFAARAGSSVAAVTQGAGVNPRPGGAGLCHSGHLGLACLVQKERSP